ncbi:MAG TPA: hypothetical protein VGJ32_16775 [Solirubrobacteraceae bacterium]|jgi:hypothetical protein
MTAQPYHGPVVVLTLAEAERVRRELAHSGATDLLTKALLRKLDAARSAHPSFRLPSP